MSIEEHKHEKALEAIETGKVKMKPRWYFLGKTALLITGTILLLLVILFLASFAIFATRQTGIWFVPSFGFRGLGIILRSLPWLIIILVLVFSAILEFLVKQYSFGYRRPLFYSMAAIMLLAILGGIFLEMTPIHRGLFRYARRGQLPFGGQMYRQFGGGMMIDSHIIAGNIISTSTSGFNILTPRDESVFVKIDSNTEISTSTEFKIGDAIIAFVERNDGTVTALGIKKINDEMYFPRERVNDGDGDDFPRGMHRMMLPL